MSDQQFPRESRKGSDSVKSVMLNLAVEIIAVVLGIWLALAANNWQENRKNEDLAERALRSIRDELSSNIKTLNLNMPLHQTLLDSLEASKQRILRGAESPNLVFNPTLLSQTAWTTANLSQATLYMSYESLQALSRAYMLTEFYMDFTRSFIAVTLTPDYHDKNRIQEQMDALEMTVTGALSLETVLLETYQQTLDKIDTKPAQVKPD